MLIELLDALMLTGRLAGAATSPALAAVSAPNQEIAPIHIKEADLSGAWKRREDPRDVGIVGKWHAPKTDDSRWDSVEYLWANPAIVPVKKGAKTPGKGGFGRFWLRKMVELPAGGPARLFLSLSHPGDTADVFINGTLLAKDLPGGVPTIREITRYTGTEGEFLLAMRVKKSRTSTGTDSGSVHIYLSDKSRPLFSGLR